MLKRIENSSFFLMLAFVTILFVALLSPFAGALFWSVIISIMFTPLQKKLVQKIGRKNLSALLTLFICCLLVIVPFLWLGSAFLAEGLRFFELMQSGAIDLSKNFDEVKQAFPFIQDILDRLNYDQDKIKAELSKVTMTVSAFFAQYVVSFGQGAMSFVLQLGILLYVSFFVLRDSDYLLVLLYKALPLGDERERLFFTKFSEVTRATVKGSLIVAMVQGALGGFIFWVVDVPAPILWGVVMTLLSLIPMVGAGLVWLPVAIYYLATGNFISAIILISFGVFVIGLVDNILRPILVGRDTKLPDYLVLLSTLGGFSLFGMNGFILGPLIAALFIVSWSIFIEEYNTPLIIEE